MRLILAIVIFSASFYLAYFAYSQGVKYQNCGCACCPGADSFPTMPMLYFQDDYKQVEPLPYEYCQLVGCSAPRVPLFLDLFGGAGILFLLGLMILFRNESSLLK
jgi:hypothetical protein